MNSFGPLVYLFGGANATEGVLPRQRLSRVLGMLSSLEVQVLRPT